MKSLTLTENGNRCKALSVQTELLLFLIVSGGELNKRQFEIKTRILHVAYQRQWKAQMHQMAQGAPGEQLTA